MPMLRLPERGSRVTTQGRVMKRPPSWGQHLRMGNWLRSKLSLTNDFFAGRVFGADGFGEGAGERAQLRQHLELVEEAFGGFDVHQALDALGDLIETVDAEGQRHAALAAELVDEDLVAGMAFYVFKEQGRAAGFWRRGR